MASNNTANIWKFSIFRFLGSLFKSTPRSQKNVLLPEEGVARSIELPMATGWESLVPDKCSWAAIHKLKVRIVSTGEDVFFICDRSYIPLNPCNILSKEEIQRLIPLKEIAAAKYDESLAGCASRTKNSNAHKILVSLLYFSLVSTALIVLVVLVKGRAG